jgi:uncharacterized protein (DUF362 family)
VCEKYFNSVIIAANIVAADSMVVVSHSKSHGIAKLGGALKNIGMGCASGDGKREQHTMHPFFEKMPVLLVVFVSARSPDSTSISEERRLPSILNIAPVV